jgi:hypothetical protein
MDLVDLGSLQLLVVLDTPPLLDLHGTKDTDK